MHHEPDTRTETIETVRLELLYLDLSTCTRCATSWERLRRAANLVGPVLEALGVRLEVGRTQIRTETQARALGFVSSPTIRVNGADIAPDLRESPCAPCTELCGCDPGEAVGCRVWSYRGQEDEAAPVGLIVEAVLRAALGVESTTPERPFGSSSVAHFLGAGSRGEGCCGSPAP